MRRTNYSVADVNKSHDVYAKVTLLVNGAMVNGEYALTGGDVDVDATAAVRRRCTLEFAGYHPELDPSTTEFLVWRSVDDEYVPLGVFRFEEPEYTISKGQITTKIDGYDRAFFVSQLRLPRPFSIAAGTLVHDAIYALLSSRYPGIVVNFTPSTFQVPATTFDEQADPWESALTMAESSGMELFFDVDGVCVLRPYVDDLANVVAHYGAEARILKMSKKLSLKNSRSHAIVISENPALPAPLRSDRYDNNSASKTYYLGNFGDRPVWLNSQLITSQPQADTACDALLARRTGRTELISIEGIPNPAHSENDVIRITNADLDVDAIYVIDALKIPLELNKSMPIRTRERRVA